MAIQSLGQSIPAGGVTAQQPVQPAGSQTPADIQAVVEALTPIQARFRQQSSFLKVALPQANLGTPGLGVDVPVSISNVGLAVDLVTEWNVTITVANGATGAEVFTLSRLFPWNLISNTSIQINGGAAIYSASGVSDYSLMTRQRRGSRRLVTYSNGWSTNTNFGPHVNSALFSKATYGSNLTLTAGSSVTPALSGVTSISVAGSASTNNTIVLTFVTRERIVLDKDSLLGAPPLQNNSTFVQVTRRLIGALSAALSSSANVFNTAFSNPGADLTFTLTTATADTSYEFASVPGDPSLYASLVTNSFQQQEQRGFVVSATGSEAYNYPIPTNNYLVALHNIVTDGNGAGLPCFDATNGLGLLKLTYAGNSVIPVREFAVRDRAYQYLDYDYDPLDLPFSKMWDGERTADDITATDNMGWLDCYATASPTELIDVGASATTSLTANITREVVIVGNVQQLGG